jgi:hypothetical protein
MKIIADEVRQTAVAIIAVGLIIIIHGTMAASVDETEIRHIIADDNDTITCLYLPTLSQQYSKDDVNLFSIESSQQQAFYLNDVDNPTVVTGRRRKRSLSGKTNIITDTIEGRSYAIEGRTTLDIMEKRDNMTYRRMTGNDVKCETSNIINLTRSSSPLISLWAIARHLKSLVFTDFVETVLLQNEEYISLDYDAMNHPAIVKLLSYHLKNRVKFLEVTIEVGKCGTVSASCVQFWNKPFDSECLYYDGVNGLLQRPSLTSYATGKFGPYFIACYKTKREEHPKMAYIYIHGFHGLTTKRAEILTLSTPDACILKAHHTPFDNDKVDPTKIYQTDIMRTRTIQLDRQTGGLLWPTGTLKINDFQNDDNANVHIRNKRLVALILGLTGVFSGEFSEINTRIDDLEGQINATIKDLAAQMNVNFDELGEVFDDLNLELDETFLLINVAVNTLWYEVYRMSKQIERNRESIYIITINSIHNQVILRDFRKLVEATFELDPVVKYGWEEISDSCYKVPDGIDESFNYTERSVDIGFDRISINLTRIVATGVHTERATFEPDFQKFLDALSGGSPLYIILIVIGCVALAILIYCCCKRKKNASAYG